MFKKICYFLAFFLFLFFVNSTVSATSYYVANAGNDSCDGTSQTIGSSGACAWRTIAKVNSSSFSAGDSISFNKGDTWREQLTIPSSGSSGNPITFGAYGSGNNPKIVGSTAVSTWINNSVTQILGDVLTESFDATGYDSPTWSESVGAGSVVDEDNTAITDSAGGSTQILKIQKVSPNWGAWTRRTLTEDNAITYSQFYVYVAAEGLSNSNGVDIAYARDSSARTTWSLQLFQNSSGQLQWNMGRYTGGLLTASGVSPSASVGQWYKHDIKYDKTNLLWEWKINGSSVASGSLVADVSDGIRDIRFGSFAADITANTYYLDSLKVSSTGYPVSGSVGNTWKATYTGTPAAIWFVGSDQVIHLGRSVADDSAAVNTYDWFTDGSFVYINSGGTTSEYDPDILFSSVELSTRSSGVFNQGKSYVTIQDIDTQFANSNGIYLYREADNITIQRCNNTYNYANGIFSTNGPVGGTEAPDDIVVSYCNASYNGNRGISAGDYSTRWTFSHNTVHNNGHDSTQSWPSGIYSFGPNGGGGHIVEYNTVYSNGNTTDTSGGGGIWFDRVDELSATPSHIPVIIRYNTTYNNYISGIFIEKTSNSQIYNNISYNNVNGSTLVAGIQLDAYMSHNASGNNIYNNIFYGNYIGIRLRSDSSLAGQLSNNLIKNNISSGNTFRQLSAITGADNQGLYGSGNIYTYNAFGPETSNFIEWGSGVYKSTYADFETAYGSNTHSIQTDPLFVSTSTPDFHLQSTSNAINAGIDVGLTSDYSGNAIIGLPDIGAYEYQPAATPTPTVTPTPIPTTAPSSTSSSSASSSSTYNNSCSSPAVSGTADLFQINMTDSTAIMYFSPVSDASKYYISFSENPSAEGNGAEAILYREGVKNYKVNMLYPGRTYYFKVRGGNGCATGKWSNIMTTRTNGRGNKSIVIYYKIILSNLFNNSINKVHDFVNTIVKTINKKPLIPSKTFSRPTIKPVVINTPPNSPKKKFCLLNWCF